MKSQYHFNFEELIVYQKAIEYDELVHKQLNNFTKIEDYRLSFQFARVADSVAFNIAEGSGSSDAGFLNYLRIARDSYNVWQQQQKRIYEIILPIKKVKIIGHYLLKLIKCYQL